MCKVSNEDEDNATLCVTRKSGEGVVIRCGGRVVRVWVRFRNPKNVKLYVDAPRDWSIVRAEIANECDDAD